MELLEENKRTTSGMDAFMETRELQEGRIQIPRVLLPNPHEEKHIFIAGLAVLSDAESVLLKALWQKGAHI